MTAVFSTFRVQWTALSPLLRHPAVCGRCKRQLVTSTQNHSTTSNEDTVELDTFEGPIPREKLDISFSRSSGPGGQNVNKLNTKAEVRFHVGSADWLPQRVKDRVQTMFKSRVTRDGELVVTSQEHRTQHRNLEAAVSKLGKMIQEASEIPRGPSELTLARIRVLKRKAQHRKRVEKKYNSEKKQDRSFRDID